MDALVVPIDAETADSASRKSTIDALGSAKASLGASCVAQVSELNALVSKIAARGAIWHRSITSREARVNPREALVVPRGSIVTPRGSRVRRRVSILVSRASIVTTSDPPC
jgi:hypothetical protein